MGEGPREGEIVQLSAEHKNIFFNPSVEHNRVVKIAQSADYGLCLIENASLSDYYCLPNKLFEYAFANLEIIGSNLPEIRKLITNYSLGECIDNDIASLTRLIELNDSKQTSLKKSLNKNFLEFAWDEQSKKLITLYANMCEN